MQKDMQQSESVPLSKLNFAAVVQQERVHQKVEKKEWFPTLAKIGYARQNIMGGAQFLKYLMGKFDKLEHVLAAYNAGETNVRRYNGIPPFKETQGYVKKVLQLMPTYATHFAPKPESADTLAANN